MLVTRTMSVATLVAIAAMVSVAAVVVPWDDPARQPAQPCVALRALESSLSDNSVTDQALIRARAARLSVSLDRRADRLEAPDGVDAQVAAGLRVLLVDPNATVKQMVTLLEPVSARCSTH